MRIFVIVPSYNEWPHLLPVLQGLRRHFSRILVVDDGSNDKSFLPKLKLEGFEYLNLPFNMGHWGAIQAGFRYGLAKNFDGTITFDGDGQHLPEEIPKILYYLEQGYDLVIGGDDSRGGFLRKKCAKILKRISGLEINDFTSGFRGYSRRAMEKLITTPFANLEYQDLGVLYLAKEKGLTAIETRVKMRKRQGEKSRVFPGLTSIVRYILITLTFIVARKL
ncbi:MAG: glycosyltransferase family 2 protein [Desulfobacterales bacterium]|nr:glycosyltransferase family 2 protein [Desulfobacterales bacterium]